MTLSFAWPSELDAKLPPGLEQLMPRGHIHPQWRTRAVLPEAAHNPLSHISITAANRSPAAGEVRTAF
eukprot:m.357139 g.357139  ORF g.357139 m.357139 type:complete len:68 (-) comp19936_c1_seq2:1143-1346(-)